VGRHVVDVLKERGHDPVSISRASGVDVITGDGLAEALAGAEVIIDTATGPSPDEESATEFFTAETRNLQQEGERAGVKRIVVVSIVNADRLSEGYNAAKVAHEKAMLAGPIPVRILRATQFHEFVQQLVDWGRDGDVSHVWKMRTQLVAARSVAEELVDLALDDAPPNGQISEIAGPRPENLAEVARLLVERTGESLRIEEDDAPFAAEAYAAGAALPGPNAKVAGPTFEEWLAAA
jgi:uncharacterized protein YbjT (DUF2867 family)